MYSALFVRNCFCKPQPVRTFDICEVPHAASTRQSQQDRQCTYKATQRRARESLLSWKMNKYYIFVCVCVCARAYARAWVPGRLRVCICVRVALLIQHTMRMRHVVTFEAPLAPPHFLLYLINCMIFGKKIAKQKMRVLIFSTTFI